MTWKTSKLGNHISILSGFAFKSERFNTEKNGTPLIRIRDILSGNTNTFFDGKFDPCFLVSNGDILIGMDGEFNCARWQGIPALLNQRVCRVKKESNALDEAFLLHFLPKTLKAIEHKTPFVTVRHLSAKEIKSIDIPLPPIDEQRRIAAILDQADELRRKRRQAMERLDGLVQVIFVQIFGDLRLNPNRYNTVSLGTACDVRDGTHDSPKYTEIGYPLVTSKNLTGGKIDLNGASFISKTDFDAINRRSKVDTGDILMPMIGTIGFPVVVEHQPNYAIKNVALIKFREASPSNSYVLGVLQSSYFGHLIASKNRGGTQKFLSLGDLRSFPLPLPSKTEQEHFARIMVHFQKTKMAQMLHMGKLDALFASLQHRAFRGELTPSTPEQLLAFA